jgi:hypothetical protein
MSRTKTAQSVLVKYQHKNYKKTWKDTTGQKWTITAQVRHDDQCGNGHNSFAITGNIFKGGEDYIGGCIHKDIAEHFPELAPFIRFHLYNTEGGPMHYLANTIYLAGERDCHGLLKGEFRQHLSRGKYQAEGIEGVPNWELKINGLPKNNDIYATGKPDAPTITAEWVPSGRTGEGKERQLGVSLIGPKPRTRT